MRINPFIPKHYRRLLCTDLQLLFGKQYLLLADLCVQIGKFLNRDGSGAIH